MPPWRVITTSVTRIPLPGLVGIDGWFRGFIPVGADKVTKIFGNPLDLVTHLEISQPTHRNASLTPYAPEQIAGHGPGRIRISAVVDGQADTMLEIDSHHGTVDGDVINGNIKGTVIATSTFEGKWNANAKNNSFKATVTTAGSYGDDKLAKNFIEGLNAATSYEGDSNNLYLLYKPASGKQTFRMVFRVVSSK